MWLAVAGDRHRRETLRWVRILFADALAVAYEPLDGSGKLTSPKPP